MVRIFLAIFLILASAGFAQAGQLTGTVTDQQGLLIPRAKISARSNKTNSEFITFANEVGVWTIPSLPSGIYTVEVTAQGFATSKSEPVAVGVEGSRTVDTTMQVGLVNLVVETVSKYEEEVINAPATATVISEPMILNSSSPNIGDLLRSVTGVNVERTSAREFNVTSRAATGLLSGIQLALIDGRTIYHDDVGYLCWDGQATNLSDIKQVEVIHGPASAIWGSYAMNGIINIITKPPREMLGSAFTAGIGTFDRSGGAADSDRGSMYHFSASHAQALNDRWAFKIGGGALTQDAFARPQGNIRNAFNTPYPAFKNEGTTQPNIEARVDYDLPDGNQHVIFAGGYGGTSGILHSGMGPTKVESGYMKSYGKVDYLRGSFRLTGYVNLSGGETSYLLLVDPTGKPLHTDDSNQTYHLEFSDSRMIQGKHLVSYGGNYRRNQFHLVMAPDAKSRNEGGTYLQDEIKLSDHFRWVVGARMDKFEFLKGTIVSPRTTFMVKPTEGQTIRVSYNRAYMAPTILTRDINLGFMMTIDLDPSTAEYYFSFPISIVGNKDLKESSLNAYEIGYSAIVASGRANIGAAFYINDTRNGFGNQMSALYNSKNPPPGWPLPLEWVDLYGLPSLVTYRNLGKVRNKGLELSLDARLNRYFSGYANYSWQARPEPDGFDISLINIPPAHRFNAGMDLSYKRYFGNVSVGYVGSAYWNDVIGPQFSGPTDAYTTVNAGGGLGWGETRHYTVMLKIANLANTPIQNHVFGDILERQIAGEFRMRF